MHEMRIKYHSFGLFLVFASILTLAALWNLPES